MMVGQIQAALPAPVASGPGKAGPGGGASFLDMVMNDPAEPGMDAPLSEPEEDGVIASEVVDDPAMAVADDIWPGTRLGTWIAVSEAALPGLRQSGSPGSAIRATAGLLPSETAGTTGDDNADGRGAAVWAGAAGVHGPLPGRGLALGLTDAFPPHPLANGSVIAGQAGRAAPGAPAIGRPQAGTSLDQVLQVVAPASGEAADAESAPQVSLPARSDVEHGLPRPPALPTQAAERAVALRGPEPRTEIGSPHPQPTDRSGQPPADAGIAADVTVIKTAKMATSDLPASLPQPALQREARFVGGAPGAPDPALAATEARRRQGPVSGVFPPDSGARSGMGEAVIWQASAGPASDPHPRPGRDRTLATSLRLATDRGASAFATDSGSVNTVTAGAVSHADPVASLEQGQSLQPGGAMPLTESSSQRAQMTPHAPGPQPDVRRIAEQLSAHISTSSEKATEVTLHPEELGRVRMLLRVQDGGMTLHLITDRPETADLMRRNIEQLASDFRSLGYTSLDFKFSGQGAGRRDGQGGAFGHSDRPPGEAVIPEDCANVVVPGPGLRLGSNLDLRL